LGCPYATQHGNRGPSCKTFATADEATNFARHIYHWNYQIVEIWYNKHFWATYAQMAATRASNISTIIPQVAVEFRNDILNFTDARYMMRQQRNTQPPIQLNNTQVRSRGAGAN
jgi:hypothetical protein